MANLTFITSKGETIAFEGLTAQELHRIHLFGEEVSQYSLCLTDFETLAGHTKAEEVKTATIRVSEFKRVNNTPEAIAKAIKSGRSFYVSIGQDPYCRATRKYDVYLGQNDFDLKETSETSKETYDGRIEHGRDYYLTPKHGKPSASVYNYTTHAGEKFNPMNEYENLIEERLPKIKNQVLKENLEKAIAKGDRWMIFTHTKESGEGIRLSIYPTFEDKPERVRRVKLSKEIEEKTNIHLAEWQIRTIEEKGFKIVRTKKAK